MTQSKLFPRVEVSSKELILASSFAAGLLSFLAFMALLFASTSANLLWGTVKDAGEETIYGIGPFIAGSSSKNSDVVWWSDLNSDNACGSASKIRLGWSERHGLCDRSNTFAVPSSTMAIQWTSSIATALSCIACSLSFSSQTKKAITIVCACSVLAMLFSCIHFALWTTHPLAKQLQLGLGDVVPLWEPGKVPTLHLSPQVHMSFGISYGLFVTSFVLLVGAVAVSYSMAIRPMKFFDHGTNDEGSFGLGKL